MLRFSKKKCLKRLDESELSERLSSEDFEILKKLDGCPATASIFSTRILFEDFLFCNGRDGVGFYVRAEDCE